MTPKAHASLTIDAAIHRCATIQRSWSAAADALAGTVTTNGFGIYRDRFELRDKLTAAARHIDAAIKELDAVEWPTDSQYDLL